LTDRRTARRFRRRTVFTALLVAFAAAGPLAFSSAADAAEGAISGRVTAAATKAAIAGIEVCAAEEAFEAELFGQCATTNSVGEYTISGLAPGSYAVSFSAPEGSGLNYVTQYYAGKSSAYQAETVAVEAGKTVAGVNAAMLVGGRITGTVTDASSKAAIAGVRVCAFTRTPPEYYEQCAKTNSTGEYAVSGLLSGSYSVYFYSPEGSGLNYIAQYYDEEAPNPEGAMVSVAAGSTVSGVDAAMLLGGQIAGEVTAAAGNGPLADVQVCSYADDIGYEQCTSTNASGEYVIAALSTGEYSVSFDPTSGNYLSQYYDGRASFEEADPVAVAAGSSVSGINAALAAGAEISGEVTSATSKAPLGGVEVCAQIQTQYGDEGGPCHTTNAAGEYTIVGLATGEYEVEFEAGAANYITQYYDDKASAAEASVLSVTAGSTKSGIDAAMLVGGEITGTISSAATKAALGDVEVCATSTNGGAGQCASTNSTGEYVIVGLASGEYTVDFNPYNDGEYLQQYYNGQSSSSEANAVSVTAGETTPGIDAAMVAGGQITGKVTSASSKAALGGIQICLWTSTGGYEGRCTTTSAAGEYAIGGLASGEYKVEFYSSTGAYFTQYYDGQTALAEASAIAVTAPDTTSGIDAAMVEGGRITGTVTSATTKAGVEGVTVCADSDGEEYFGRCTQTNAAGEYTLVGLSSGAYAVSFEPGSGNYLPQYYDGKPSASEANLVSVVAGSASSGIDAALAAGGQLSGKVTAAATSEAVAGIEVCALALSVEAERCASTNTSGEYTIEGLPSDSYTVRFAAPEQSELNYLPQYYDGKSLYSEATPVSVTAGSATPSIDAAMAVGAKITGTVTGASSKAPLKGIQVCASPTGHSEDEDGGCATTGATGEYTLRGLATGEYTVEFSAPYGSGLDYAEQYYDGKAAAAEANHVAVTAGSTQSGIDAAMVSDGEITGTVTDAVSKAAVRGIQVCLLATSGYYAYHCTTSLANGEYKLTGLEQGEYKVEFSVPYGSELNYLPQYYAGKGALSEAVAVSVSDGTVTSGISAAMVSGAEITGKVTNASTKAGLGGIEVCPMAAGGGSSGQCVTSSVGGEYKLLALATGEYKIEFYSETGANYVEQYYEAKSSYSEANAVSVTDGTTTTGIDAAMVVGGKITGRVTGSSTKAALAGIEVCSEPTVGAYGRQCARTGSSGEYAIAGLATGEYRVEFLAPYGSALDYLSQYYDDRESSGEANSVAVTAGASTSGIDAAMTAGGAIDGKVTDFATKDALEGIYVCLELPKSTFFSTCTDTNADGEYSFLGLAGGEYRVEFESFEEGYSTQYYDNKGSASEADPVSVTTGVTTSSVDAAMVVGGEVTGTVTSAVTKAGIEDVEVCAQASGPEPFTRCADTGATGEYTISGLASGEYKIEFNPVGQDYLHQYYDGAESSSQAASVSVSAGSITTGIDAALPAGGEITGQVTSASGNAALAGIGVCAQGSSGGWIPACATSNANGEYTLEGLATGEYKIEFYPDDGTNYLAQYYKDKSSFAQATPVSVTAGATTTAIDASMVLGGQISGKTTNASTKAAIGGIEVCAEPTDDELLLSQPCSTSGADGEYTILGLPTGQYKVEFNPAVAQNYLAQFYVGQSTYAEATPVSVTAGATTSTIDAAMIVGGEITGTVSEASTKAPISGIEVCSAPSEDESFFYRCTTTNASGEYTIVALDGGNYDVRFSSPDNSFAVQYYNRVTSLAFSTSVAVSTGSTTSAIDAELANLPVSSTPPTITGTAQQAHTLTEVHGSWKNSPTEYSYQWELCNASGDECAEIAGATRQTYVPDLADAGHTLRAIETASNLAGAGSPASSAATAVVLPLPPVEISAPSISGTAQQGKTLTEDHGAWENSPSEYRYQWMRCGSAGTECAAIAGASNQTYVPVAADVGDTLAVQETAGNAGGLGSPAISAVTAVVVPPVPVNKSVPTISGSAVQGQTLSEVHGGWEYSPSEYAYEWQRCNGSGAECAVVAGATEQTYALSSADVGHTIRVQEIAINAGGASAPADSTVTAKVAAAAPVDITPPTISGTAQQGETLTETHGSWTNEPTGYEYQWLRCDGTGTSCTAISGATGQSYVPVAADVGGTLEVRETARNAGGPGVPGTSAPTGTVTPPVPVNVESPSIAGAAVQGQALTEVHGTWEYAPTGYAYQWLQCDSEGNSCAAISGATEDTYVPTAADVGHRLEVQETATNAGGTSKPAVSAASAAVLAAKPADITPPTISGTAQQGETLTEAHGSWTNEPTGYEYQWLRCDGTGKNCTAISGADEQSYELTAADVGHTIAVSETARNAAGPSSPATSVASAEVLPAVPANVSVPTVSGNARQGETLTEVHGSWTNDPSGYEYQWLQCNQLGSACLPISGATGQSYVLVAADVGHTLEVQETARNSGGASQPATSTATAPVLAAVPINTSPPTISGETELHQTLVAEHGSWSNEPTSYEQQWLRCDATGANCQPIAGAVAATYVTVAADIGHTIAVREVATNAGGPSAPATSAATSPITLPPLRASAGEDLDATVGVPVTLDASGSSPASEITAYSWEFGDGTSASGSVVSHAYRAPGTYTASVTVHRGGEAAEQHVTVTVVAPPTHSLTVNVRDGNGDSLPGVEVLYIGPSGTRIEGVSGANGAATLDGLPDGQQTFYVWASGYQPAVGHASVTDGEGEATVTLASGAVATSTLKSHEMDLQEIEAAGIDTSDPANQRVFEFEIRLAFIETPIEQQPPPLHCYINSEGRFVGPCSGGTGSYCTAGACYWGWSGGGGGGGGGACCGGGGGGGGGCCGSIVAVPKIVEGHPLIQWLILRGKATILKQFFSVTMITQNLSPEPFKLTNGSATLDLPPGLSLAPTARSQSLTQPVPDIPGLSSASTEWVVRGDETGEYLLSASYRGTLEPFAAPVELDAALASPLKVWGANALALSVKADNSALAEGVPYHVWVSITNKAEVPLYNVDLAIDEDVHANFLFQPRQSFHDDITELKPGQTLTSHEYILVPDAASVSTFNPSLSSAAFDGEEAHPGQGIEAVPPPPLYALSGPSDTPNMVHLHWASVPGAEGYEVFPTPNLETPFAESPESVLASPSSETGLTELPATATNAYIFASSAEAPKDYAVGDDIAGSPLTWLTPRSRLTCMSKIKEPTSLIEAIRYFSDLDVCTDYVAKRRWPNGPVCPRCGCVEYSYLTTRRLWKCKGCKKQYSIKLGTIFEDSPLGLDKWLPAMWLVANSKNGVSSHELGRALGVTQKSAWFMLHRIRLAMQTPTYGRMSGEVEVDETFVGGKARNMHAKDRDRKGIKGAAMAGKTPVFGMIERGGRVRAEVVPNVKGATLRPKIKDGVAPGSTVYTDALPSYNGLGVRFSHKTIDHAERYVDGRVHTNTIENFWSLVKRSLNGTYVSVEPFHLFRYLDERVFTFNERESTDYGRFDTLVGAITGRRLTYAEVTGQR